MVFTQDRRVIIEIEVFLQSQNTEKGYLVTLLRQTYTLVGVLNFYEEEPDNSFWELILPELFNIQATEGLVQLRRVVFDLLVTPNSLSVKDNFFFNACFILDSNIDQDTENVQIEATVLSMVELT
jgi:hypothetical protein